MRLLAYNGSPRHKTSNTRVFLEQILAGWQRVSGETPDIHYLYPKPLAMDHVAAFAQADVVLLAMPLYADAMPSGVMEFFASLGPVRELPRKPALVFFVQSGFPEACHSRPFERYLQKLARRLGCPYLGTIIRGGGEGIKMQPASATKKLFARLQSLGADLASGREMNPATLKSVAGRERFSGAALWMFRIAFAPLIGKIFWDAQMKKNGVKGLGSARPYALDQTAAD